MCVYDLRLLNEMRHIQRVGVWPVGLVGGLMVERPLVNACGLVFDWLTGWLADRLAGRGTAPLPLPLRRKPKANPGSPRGRVFTRRAPRLSGVLAASGTGDYGGSA